MILGINIIFWVFYRNFKITVDQKFYSWVEIQIFEKTKIFFNDKIVDKLVNMEKQTSLLAFQCYLRWLLFKREIWETGNEKYRKQNIYENWG